MTLKKCWKLHKLFLTELERCNKLEKEGDQVLSSMANVSKRFPLLLGDKQTIGVLAYVADTADLLLRKHLAALDKSIVFLRDIMRDLMDSVRRMRNYVEEYVELVDTVDVTVDETVDTETTGRPDSSIILMFQLQEWMENVRIMYEREMLRKRLVVKDLDYANHSALQHAYSVWSIHSGHCFVDAEYVTMGTAILPPLPLPVNEENSKTTSKSSKKNNRK